MKKRFIVQSTPKNSPGPGYDIDTIVEAESYDGAWQKVVDGALLGDALYDIKVESLREGIAGITIFEVAGSREDHYPAWLEAHIQVEERRRASEERDKAEQEYERMREECHRLEEKFGFNRY